MIFSSKRCFLNVLTQMLTADQLTHANYFIGDSKDRIGGGYHPQQVNIDDNGNTYYDNTTHNAFNVYEIHQSDVFDLDKACTALMTGYSEESTKENEIQEYLNKPKTFLSVYNFLFREPLKHSDLQILLLNDDSNVVRYGHMICQYLSYNFGIDITYIDPAFRKRALGQTKYVGNKQVGMKTIRDVKDLSIRLQFDDHVTTAVAMNSVSNLREYLHGFEYDELVHLWFLLFPTAPLPPSNDVSVLGDAIIEYTMSSIDPIGFSDAMAKYKQGWNSVKQRAEQEITDWNDFDYASEFSEYGADDGLF